MTSKRIIRLPAVMEATGLSRSLIYLYISQEKFPKQIKLGERAAGWLVEEIEAWITGRIDARSKKNLL